MSWLIFKIGKMSNMELAGAYAGMVAVLIAVILLIIYNESEWDK